MSRCTMRCSCAYVQPVRDLERRACAASRGPEPPALAQDLLERHALEQLHRDVVASRRPGRRRTRVTMFGWLSAAAARASRRNSSTAFGWSAQVVGQALQRDDAPEPAVARLEHDAHAAAADLLEDLVAAGLAGGRAGELTAPALTPADWLPLRRLRSPSIRVATFGQVASWFRISSSTSSARSKSPLASSRCASWSQVSSGMLPAPLVAITSSPCGWRGRGGPAR